MSAEALRAFHERTKHSPRSIRETSHFLDWANQPSRLKEYRALPIQALPPFRPTGIPCHRAVAASASPGGDASLDVEGLSYLLFQAAGVSRTVRAPLGEFRFRTYASAGALYPNEVYVVAGEVKGLDPGVYHYAPERHGLRRLRAEDARGGLGLVGESPGAATLVLTGIPWRTSWKYQARGFRHLFWDAGMMLANLLAAAAARGVRARVLLGFVDEAVNTTVGVDGREEFALAVVPLGRGVSPAPIDLPPLALEVEPVSPQPFLDPEIETAHAATVLASEDEVAAFRQGAARAEAAPAGTARETPAPSSPVGPSPLPEDLLSTDPLEEVVRRRGSSRRQARAAFPARELGAILGRALAGLPADWLVEAMGLEALVVASALEGLPPGVHRFLPDGRFAVLREGSFRGDAGYLCLEQRLAADAASVTFLLADLDRYLSTLGGRGYAAAQLEGGIAAGRVYLGAYAQCLGASGITFYDDEVRRFLDTGREPMLVVVAGPEGHRTSIRRCREARRPSVPG